MKNEGGLGEIRAELAAAGVYRRHERAGWLRLALMVTLAVGSLAALLVLPAVSALLLVPVAALALTTAAMMGHEGSHGSFSSSKRQNRVLTVLTFPLLSGMSELYWHRKHDGAHHGHPNVDGKDPDVDLWPMASSRQEHDSAGPVRRWFQRHLQGWAYWPLTSLMVLGMRVQGVRHLVSRAREGGVDRRWAIDAVSVILHHVLWFGLGTWAFGLGPFVAIYTAVWALVSVCLALIFSPAHIGLPVLSTQHPDWLHQLETTRNFRVPRWTSWFFVGLDHQIEHHLFPRIAHQELPRASLLVKAWAHRVGAPHRTVGYGEALWSVTRAMHVAWSMPTVAREQVRATADDRAEQRPPERRAQAPGLAARAS